MGETAEIEPIHPCCGGYREHRYRCPARVWPTTATPEIRRQAIRGDCIALAHAWTEDLGVRGLDYQQRKRLTGILAQVWDDGCEYGRGLGDAETAECTHQWRDCPVHGRSDGGLPPVRAVLACISGGDYSGGYAYGSARDPDEVTEKIARRPLAERRMTPEAAADEIFARLGKMDEHPCPRGVGDCDGTACTWKCPADGSMNCHEAFCYLCGGGRRDPGEEI